MKIKIDDRNTSNKTIIINQDITEIDTYGDVIIKEAYSGLVIKTNGEGKELHICLRDWGFDMKIDDGNWFHINTEEDICCVSCQRKKKLEKIKENENKS